MGYPVHSDVSRIPKLELEAQQQEFIKQEYLRHIVSMSHSDAIETTNLGVDWFSKAMSRTDRDIML